jgi:hypothetical protein
MFTTGASSGGPVKTARVIYQRAGMKGFLRGWSASYMRLGPQTLVRLPSPLFWTCDAVLNLPLSKGCGRLAGQCAWST